MSATTLNQSASTTNTAAQTNRIIWFQRVAWVFAGITAMALLVYGYTALNFLTRPFIGATVTRTLAVNAGLPAGDIAWPAREAGIRVGDFIVAVNGQDLFATEDRTDFWDAGTIYESILSSLDGTTPITIDFIRNTDITPINDDICNEAGGVTACSVTFTPLPNFPEVDFLSFFVLSFGTGIAIFALGIVALRYQGDEPEGIMVACIAFLTAIFTAGFFDIGNDAVLGVLWVIAAPLVAGSLVSFTMIFPRKLRFVRNVPYSEYVPIGLMGLLGLVATYNLAFPSDAMTYRNWAQITSLTASCGIVVALVFVLFQRERATTPASRDQSNTIFIGMIMMLIPVMLWALNNAISAQVNFRLFFILEQLMPLLIFPIAGLVYSVLQYRRLDTDRIISQGLTYTIMGSALILAISLLTLGGTLFAIEFLNARDVVTISIVIFMMVFAFTPLRNHLQERIDEIYFRKRYDYQLIVEDFSNHMTTASNYDTIADRYFSKVSDAVYPNSMFIFLREGTDGDFFAKSASGGNTDMRFPDSSPMIDLLKTTNDVISLQAGQTWHPKLYADQARLKLLRAKLIFPLKGGAVLNGFVIYSEPKTQSLYTHDEVRFLENITGQLAVAVERSQVIESLEQRVRQLDVLSQIGQAVNFNIDDDDVLLELIYAQTSKLVDVPNFYIAMYDERVKQMFFSFFLEDDDRIDSKENVRWELTDELFSEISQSSSGLRVKDFQEELRKRGAKNPFVSSKLKAWIGVPLLAGRRTLGVMAAGKTTPGEEYTNEQFKIFSDISSLAATSLDKVALFKETKVRERQLTVLNDISRQLVATELNVEKLLQIIMTSAVEILNAEAGALLLTTDDDTGALEFRVVIGGSGDSLLGTQVPTGKGVVGVVINTGKAQIVNDVASDPHHAEVSNEFVSRSLLAVPLIAKEEVIGVLEVINKKDGTFFVDDDADLLTTFSSQAAVAIENARLFQRTDQQLEERVRELETLERIDAELNRTLDLQEVAEITVRQAMSTLSADAGALGIVDQENNILRMVAIKGYTEEDYPDDANGTLWSLNTGIVGRVMRSHQADIAMDVAMDPDYNSKLPNSNSQITVPMLSGDDVIAILILEKNIQPRFTLPDWNFAGRIAEHASIAIANSQFYAALELANKSKSEFMGFAAHELKNPLSSVKGYADFLLQGMGGDLPDTQRNFIQVIHANANRMQTIINDLRDSARIDANEFSVDPAEINIYSAVVESLRPLVRNFEDKNQELINDVPEDLPAVWADETRVIQVLTNLVSNAHKYSPADTTIKITADVITDYHTQEGKLLGRMVQVAVIDQGLGMSEEDQNLMFKQKYFRSTNQDALDQPGTGLGMMLTKNIMDSHGGEIWFKSALGEGSTFYVSFPLAEDGKKKKEALRKSREAQTEPASD